MEKRLRIGRRMSRRTFLRTAGAGALAGMNLPLPGPRKYAHAAAPIKVGLSAPLSGVLTDYGVRLEKGTRLGVEVINKGGGILGRKVELHVEDDKTDPKTASEKANKLTRQVGVDVMLGTISSATTLAVIPHAERARIVYFYIVEGEDKACYKETGKTRKYIFGLGPTPEQKFQKFVPWLVKNYGKKFYFVGSDYVFPHSVNNAGKIALGKAGGRTVGEEYGPLGTTEWSAVLTRVERTKPDIFFISVVGTDGIAIVKQAVQFGLGKKMAITGFPAFAPEVLSGIAQYAEGIYTVENYFDGLDNPQNREFVELFRSRYPSPWPVATVSAKGYTTLHYIKKAAERAGSVRGEKFIQALEGLRLEAPEGSLQIEAGNHIEIAPLYLLRVKGKSYDLVAELGPIRHPGHVGCSA